MYLDEIATTIRTKVPHESVPIGDSGALFLLYAVLLRAKGHGVTQSDVHDAWSAWIAAQDDDHDSLVPYDQLAEEIKAEDRIFATAIREAADQLKLQSGSRPDFTEVLFPSGPPAGEAEAQQTLDLYKMMVDSSEALVSRRQGVNTFFLTINGALLTASGLIVQGAKGDSLAGLGIAVLSTAGLILCLAWRSLIKSFGQLNRGKFQVINTIEQHLKAAIYAAEWEALGRGEDTKTYRSFTSREIWVPNALVVLHSLAIVVAILVAAGCITLATGAPAA